MSTFADNLRQLPAIDHLSALQLIDAAGQVAATKVGAAPKNQLQAWIEQSI